MNSFARRNSSHLNFNGKKVMEHSHTVILVWTASFWPIFQNQKEHHHKKTFKEEYNEFLEKFKIEHDPKYLFEWIE